MRYIDPHIHMVSRTTDDYQRMAQAGCIAVTEPAFWAGFDRSSAQGFFDYFRQLTEYEPKRAAQFGIKHFTWLCINPKEADDPGFAREVIALIPDFLGKGNGSRYRRNWPEQEHEERVDHSRRANRPQPRSTTRWCLSIRRIWKISRKAPASSWTRSVPARSNLAEC